MLPIAITPAHLSAATITVTSTADGGSGSLRTALVSVASGDTIDFSLPAPAKITLTSGESSSGTRPMARVAAASSTTAPAEGQR